MTRASEFVRQLRWMPRTIFDRRRLGIDGELSFDRVAVPLIVALFFALVVELLDQFV